MSDTLYDAQQAVHQDAILQVVDGRTPLDAKLLRWSDWLNPILVKETRQALKSRQFMITFSLTLIAVLFWTIVSITLTIPGIYFLPGGPALLAGYFVILLIPVCVVVPMTAFRSMASELEDGTHDILSLATLTSRQVVLGKLAVALLQSLIYLSAIVPCIALTYMLRGVGFGALMIIILGTIGLSVLFSTAALLFATVAKTRDTQVLMTVLNFLVAAPLSWVWLFGAFALMYESPPLEEAGFWFGVACVFVFGLSYVWLGILAASAQIGFASDNHSTRIRWMLLFQHFLFLWCAVGISIFIENDSGEIWMFFLSLLGLHWAVAGTFIIGERSVVSPRAQRSLPRSTWGRLLTTWTNPGAGPGYIFVVTSTLSVVFALAIFQAIDWKLAAAFRQPVLLYAATIASYLALYLGLTRIILLLIGTRGRSKMLLSLLVVVILLFFGGLAPMLLSYWASGFYTVNYEPYMFTHVPWTLMELLDRKVGTAEAAVPWLFISAALVFLGNLLFAFRDVMLVRVETPQRVSQEQGVDRVTKGEDPQLPHPLDA